MDQENWDLNKEQEGLNDKEQEVITTLKENKEGARELLQELLIEKENEVKESKDPARAAIELNVYRARLYYKVGTDEALEESFNDYEDAISQALNEGRTDLANQIIAEENKYFGESN